MSKMEGARRFLSQMQAAFPMDSNWYCYTNRPDCGLMIAHGAETDAPSLTLFEDGTWKISPSALNEQVKE